MLVGLIFLLSWQVVALSTVHDQGALIALVFATFLTSIVMATALGWKPANDEATRECAVPSSFEDRFLEILRHLAAAELEIRVGAIYSLDRIRLA